MKIKIDFRRPYFDEETIFKLSLNDLDDFYTDENDVNRLNLFFVLEATLHKFFINQNIVFDYLFISSHKPV